MAKTIKVRCNGPGRHVNEIGLDEALEPTVVLRGALPAVREAAKALMTGLGVLQGIYVAILGFGETAG